MKKLFALLLAAMMVFALAACGDNNTADPDKDNPGTSQSGENNNDKGGTENQGGDNQNDDWQTIMKTTYGIDLTLPNGWSFSNIRKTSGHQFNFNYTGSDFDSAYVALCETMFDLTAAVSGTSGNFIYKDNGYVSIDEIPTIMQVTLNPTWQYNFNSNAFQLGISDYESTSSASMTFTPNGAAKSVSGGSSSTQQSQWNDSRYTAYTAGIVEPSFDYTLKGVLMDQLTINAEATEAEISAWKQSLLDAGFEEYREGEQWGIKNTTHNIQMNGFVNGIAYIYIGLEG